jgi:hypothetical protein
MKKVKEREDRYLLEHFQWLVESLCYFTSSSNESGRRMSGWNGS